jgi:ribonuclease HI
VLLLSPQGDQFKYMVHLDFKATNNMTEYEALLFGLSTALSLGVRQLLVKGDSNSLSSKSREIAPAMTRSWLPICSMRTSWERTLRS